MSPQAQQWEGWGTALKPAHEPVCFARKPLSEKTVAENVLRWATGALNVDGGRVGDELRLNMPAGLSTNHSVSMGGGFRSDATPTERNGRWPANVATDGSFDVLEAFPPSARDAIRYFYSAKADKADREFGLEDVDAQQTPCRTAHDRDRDRLNRNFHPTVKPVDLMRWLCRLVTPPGGVVLDPFMGSGTTGIAAVREGFGFVGCEQSPEYFEIAAKRIGAAVRLVEAAPDLVRDISAALSKPTQGQLL